MATVGNLASMQLRMATVAAKNNLYGSYGSYGYGNYNTSRTSTSDAMSQILKNRNDYFKQQYNDLYKSIFGKTPDGEETKSAETTVSTKVASKGVEDSAYSIMNFANGLRLGDEYDTEESGELMQKFVDSYNTFIDSVGNSDNNSVLQKGVFMVNTAKVYSSALKRVGITLGSDNKLTLDKEKAADATARELRSTFGSGGFSTKVLQKAQQVYNLSGSNGLFSYSKASSQSYSYSIGALLNMYA